MKQSKKTFTIAADLLEFLDVPPDHEKNALKILLAEYKALRTEIQNRANAQSFILQVHITALTFIMGAAATTPFFPWLIFLIPIEASIFGLWYVDHAITIAQLGDYIQQYLEPGVNKLNHSSGLLGWESGFYGNKFAKTSKKKPMSFESLLFLTFGGPSIISLIAGLINIAFSLPSIRALVSSSVLGGVPEFYQGVSVSLASAAVVVGIAMFMIYVRLTQYHMSIVHTRKVSAQKSSESPATLPSSLPAASDGGASSPVDSPNLAE